MASEVKGTFVWKRWEDIYWQLPIILWGLPIADSCVWALWLLTLSTASGWRPCVPRTSGHQDHLGCKNTFIYKYSHSDNYCWRQTLNYHRGYYFVCFLAVLKTIGWGLKQRGASAVMWPLKKINYIYCKCIISTGMYSNILLFIANNYWWVSDIENDACFIYPEIFPSASFWLNYLSYFRKLSSSPHTS